MNDVATHFPALNECYPDGVPDGFPMDMFAPVEGTDQVFRDKKLKRRIDDFQNWLLQHPQEVPEVEHFFADGMYGRQIYMKKGTLATGAVHLTDGLGVVLQGDVTMLTVDGPQRVKAPATFVTKAGGKNLGYVNEDTIWLTVHQSVGEDPELNIAVTTTSTYAEYDKLLSEASYNNLLAYLGTSEEQVRAEVEDETTLDRMPLNGVEVRPSFIEGQGLFATREYLKGEAICPGAIDDKRSLAGRYSNHAAEPNCFFADDEERTLYALHDIAEGDELTTDYGLTLGVAQLEVLP